MKENIWLTRASKLFCLVISVIIVYFIFKYAYVPLAALTVAVTVSELIDAPAKRLSEISGLSKRFFAALIMILILIFLLCAMAFLSFRVYLETIDLLKWIGANRREIINSFSSVLSIVGRIPIIGSFVDIETVAETIMREAISFVGTHLGNMTGATVNKAPQVLMWSVFSFAACIYITIDRDKIYGYISKLLPRGLNSEIHAIRSSLLLTLKKFFKAYFLIFTVTFCEMLIGLSILKARFSILISLVVAAVDILPVVGSGALLIPWALISIAMGRGGFGVALLILYGIITIVRQVVEPRIVGEGLGIHPFAIIAVMSIGISLFGARGIFFSFLCIVLFKTVESIKNKKM